VPGTTGTGSGLGLAIVREIRRRPALALDHHGIGRPRLRELR